MSVTLTEAAAKKAKELVDEYCFAGLRLATRGGGCSGFEYVLTGAAKEEPGDIVTESHGIKVYCDKKSYLFVNGTEIDYASGVMQSGFTFKNPLSKGNCGCGESFSV